MIQPTMGCFRLLLLWNTVGSRATRKLSLRALGRRISRPPMTRDQRRTIYL